MPLNKCEATKSGNVITAEGRMCYVSFFEPSLPAGETDKEKAKYQGTLAFPKGTDLSVLAAAVEACAVEKFGADYKKKERVKKPFLKVEDHPKMGLDPAEFEVFIRCSSKDRPQIVDAKMASIGEDRMRDVYSGRWGRYSVRPYAYDHKTGGKGVSLGLQNVQVLRDDEPLGGSRPRAEDDFEPAEIGGSTAGGSTDNLFE